MLVLFVRGSAHRLEQPAIPLPPAAQPVTFTGWLADTRCLGVVNGIDGVNASAEAPKHTVDCMLAAPCVASGFNLLEQVGDEYVVRYQLDDAGNALAEAKLRELQTSGVVNNVQFTVTGTPGTAAQLNGESTKDGMELGVVIGGVTAFTAGTPGETLSYPLQPALEGEVGTEVGEGANGTEEGGEEGGAEEGGEEGSGGPAANTAAGGDGEVETDIVIGLCIGVCFAGMCCMWLLLGALRRKDEERKDPAHENPAYDGFGFGGTIKPRTNQLEIAAGHDGDGDGDVGVNDDGTVGYLDVDGTAVTK